MSRAWYGSVQNRIMESSAMPKPEVGMGATECGYTDRHPYEIIEVADDRHIIVRALDYKRTDDNGMSDCQDYEYSSNPENHTAKLFLTKKGEWRERYPSGKLGCNRFFIGRAEKYYDYSF